MPQKLCESLSYVSPAPYHEPRKTPSQTPLDWRPASMHLKPYPSPQKQEPAVVEGPCTLHMEQPRALRREWASVRQSYPTLVAASSGSGTANRCPLGVLSTNTLHRSSTNNNSTAGLTSTWAGRKGKGAPPVPAKVTLTGSLVLMASPAGLENEVSLYQRIYQGEDGDGPVDILAMIKPGNTQEKIAIFAGRQRGRSAEATGPEEVSAPVMTGEGVPPQEASHFVCRVRGYRVNACCSMAKRRRLGKTEKTKGTEGQSVADAGTPPPLVALCDPQAPSPVGESEGEMWPRGEGEDGGGRMVSVVERVAVLEAMEMANGGSDQNMDFKPVQLRSGSGTLTRAKAPVLPSEPKAEVEAPGGLSGQEEAESVRVLDMVARLESECLKSQSCRAESGGELSRNNSLRRNVARVLLAGGSEPYQAPPSPSHPEPPTEQQADEQPSVAVAEAPSAETCQPHEQHSEFLSSSPILSTPAAIVALEVDEKSKAQLARVECRIKDAGQEPEQGLGPELPGTVEEPMPGMLFFRQSPPQPLSKPLKTAQHTETTANTTTTNTMTLSHCKISVTVVATNSAKSQGSVECGGSSGMLGNADQLPADGEREQALHKHENIDECGADCDAGEKTQALHGHKNSDHRDCESVGGEEEEEGTGLQHGHSNEQVEAEEGEEEGDDADQQELVSFPLQRPVSQEFLAMRFKIQQLLEPQSYLVVLPHHVLVQIFSLLPTKALAALKCSCRDFKDLIEAYDVRPTDSGWVSDPRYREDPCKHCKKRYKKGDVSLCRWHHKRYCQAMPYGPGYWMCCRAPHKDAPGCNVDLHDNRWVPTSHRIQIYKTRDLEEA
ncbi:F-box only protein 34 [Engraulis encrasicolus]|uniref:F-box only protein 34 n=1 Tax=Engraulis encrasicolus TaxID=184585 RepID=UPI002FD2152A